MQSNEINKPIRYSEKVDNVIYCKEAAKFEEKDWIDLAVAALDQAGMSARNQDTIRAKITELLFS